jgi:hypothetical protein
MEVRTGELIWDFLLLDKLKLTHTLYILKRWIHMLPIYIRLTDKLDEIRKRVDGLGRRQHISWNETW